MIQKLLCLILTCLFAISGYSQCLPPDPIYAFGLTSTSINFSWESNAEGSTWELLIVPGSVEQQMPAVDPVLSPGTLFFELQNPSITVTTLTPGTIYHYYIRTVCSSGEKSTWTTHPFFSTQLCDTENKCIYKFILADSGNNGWNGALMSVRQNGLVVALFGYTFTSGLGPFEIPIALCKDMPFEVYWGTAGTQPQQCILSVVNPFGQTLYTKSAGVGSAGSVLYQGTIDCENPVCNITPIDVGIYDVTTTGATINWTAVATDSWDIYITPSGNPVPTIETVPTYNDITQNPFTTTIPLIADASYDVYVRVNCDTTPAAWSGITTFTTIPSCYRPVNVSAPTTSITTTTAKIVWSPGSDAVASEVLLIKGEEVPNAPGANPVLGTNSVLLAVNGQSFSDLTDLEPATIYYAFVRTVCSATDKSNWTGPVKFTTALCNTADKCNYKFIMTDTGNNGWEGGRLQIRQNGIIVSTIGISATGAGPNTITVPLCTGIPFDVYWSVAGNAPQQMALTIQDPFTDVIYTKAAGSGTPLEVLYSSIASCMAPSCPRPTALAVNAATLTGTTAEISWVGNSAGPWEIYAAPQGSPLPVNNNILNDGPFYHVSDAMTYTLTGLQPLTSYTFYVRELCSTIDKSNWTISTAKTFFTKSLNDECSNAINIPVNPGTAILQSVSGTNREATSSPIAGDLNCMGADVWYSFIATNTSHICTITDNQASDSVFILFSAVYGGTDCSNLTPIVSCGSHKLFLLHDLTIGATYKIRMSYAPNVSTVTSYKNFTIAISTPQPVPNDECSTAIPVTVNTDTFCNHVTYGSITTATPSTPSTSCGNLNSGDVWFKFIPTSEYMQVAVTDIVGSSTMLNFSIATGACNNSTTIACANSSDLTYSSLNLTVGQEYYIRVWSASESVQVINFAICIKAISTCFTSSYFCGASSANPYIYANTTGINGSSNSSPAACLGSTPNPTYYTMQVGETGPLSFEISQNTQFGSNGEATGMPLDVDYVAWGPFESPQSCDSILYGACSPVPCPNNTTSQAFYPHDNVVDCSYDSRAVETLSIPNAIAGEYYIVLITNYANIPGYIKFLQTNILDPNAGQTECDDKIQLISFIDTNANGIKESDEINFTLGTFIYQKNNVGAIHNVTSPSGRFPVFDNNPTNTYDFSFQVYPELAAYYTAATTNFNDISVNGQGSQILYFPITATQVYNKIEVSIVPSSDIRVGANYSNTIVYKNLGMTAASGTLTFTKDPVLTINSISDPAATTTANGVHLNFNDLAALESRSFTVNMFIPDIPSLDLGDILTNTASVAIPGDSNNNLATSLQLIKESYDANEKTEAHGGKIEFNQFSENDYLFYTIHFQNTANASAINTRVEDLLDSQLDETSIRMVSASHNYVMERINNKVVWDFKNIMLPGAVGNETLSQGYITFKIKVKPGLAVGDIIPNTAEIYFDTNPASVTNTFNTEFVPTLGTLDFSAANITVYPNPANSRVQISVMNTNETIDSIILYDMLGKTISSQLNVDSKATAIDVSSLAKGVYMIEITTENKLRQVKKLVIE